MNANSDSFFRHPSQSRRAFTMIELLVMVAVVALLLTLHVAALASAKDQTLRAQCAGHLRQIALTTAIFANDNGDKLPVNVVGNWAWDMSGNVGNTYSNSLPLQTLYCPASGFNYDDNNRLWDYDGGAIHVIGYAQTFTGTADVFPTNFNATLTPQRIQINPTQWFPVSSASQRVLFADSIMSASGQNNPALVSTYNWTNLVGAYLKPHRTSHMDGALPAGGNMAMLDCHVEWRRFAGMLPRSPGFFNSSPTPIWWW